MNHGLIILCVLLGALFLSIAGWAIARGGTLGEDDPAEPVGYVDQDGESTPAQHQWKNAGAKA
ncbi:MAG TPA: hypothetical protein DD502_33795, partial [Cupriavidus sp.]|nr:hypothetical protein [Cupriavidus sp.]